MPEEKKDKDVKQHVKKPAEETAVQSHAHDDAYDVKTLIEWHAPGRPFQKHSKEYYINLFLITVAIEIIIFLFHQYLLMMVVLSLAFLAFALAIIPPHIFYYKITTEGIRVEDMFFLWDELYDFYFDKHNGVEVLKVGTKAYFPGELTLMLSDEVERKKIRITMLTFLPFREYVKPSVTQKAGDWLGKNFPLEKSPKK